ncbi:SDR family NAD(P)-dependent oxidoreductase [Amycolatopsis sp. GM8]|uniref:SDR family NAD(P)-dependent oxidoreductase n=1 Tax=Amycolatopsis sp. GM8 TaxID=2896530 RepID=UPI001F2D4143|nr:SDR family oxidoreductase [Amycolatopsis sp. GM8]
MPSGSKGTGDKVVIVTGAASGIGAATVRRLADHGYSVVAADLAPEVKEMATADGRISAVVADLTDESANQEMVAKANEQHGRIDAIVLNAGVTTYGSIEGTPIAEFDRVMAVNVRATVLGMQAALPSLRRSGGVISVTCSIQGLHGDPTLWIYSASKGAVVNLVRSVALELGPAGIRVNGVCPGPIAQTGMTAGTEAHHPEIFARVASHIPLQRWGTADEVAAAHLFLLSSASSFMTGSMLTLDGGLTAGTGVYKPGDV